MTKVELLDKLNTSFGLTLIIKTEHRIYAGDRITDGVDNYTVKRIIMPTVPTVQDHIAVIVDVL